MSDGDIVRNAIQTPDGTILESKHRHDCKTHVDAVNGKEYMVDGGYDYIRRSTPGPYEELSITTDSPHEVLRETVTWGTYGINGDQPLKYVTVAEMDTGHMAAVVKIPNVIPGIKEVMLKELELRNGKNNS